VSFTLIANVAALVVIAALAVLYWHGSRRRDRSRDPGGQP
jgi:hypothetical protein